MITDALLKKVIEKQNPTVVGVDTAFDYLPDFMKEGADTLEKMAEKIYAFNQKIIDAVYDLVPAVKVQIAYYEEYGTAGLECFRKTLCYAKEKGLVVISDAKRNDIGSTAERYSRAFLGKTAVGGEKISVFPSDYLTVNGYLGVDGIAPFLKDVKGNDKGIFVLVKTSNPSSGQLQDLKLDNGKTIYETMGGLVEEWGSDTVGEYGYSAVGAVVGATHKEQAAKLRKQMPRTLFLVPGYGAQGGTAEDIKVSFDERGLGAVVNSSRGILCAYKKGIHVGKPFDEAARAATLDMKADILSVLGGRIG